MTTATRSGPPPRVVVLDIDGVLTDGTVAAGGATSRRLHLRDLDALARARAAGVVVAFLTGEPEHETAEVVSRCGGGSARYDAKHKGQAIRQLAEDLGVEPAAMCYVGDARRDVPALEAAGWGCVPADGDPEARRVASHVLRSPGGRGAVAEVVDLLLASPPSAAGAPPASDVIAARAAEALAAVERFVASHLGEVEAMAELLATAIARDRTVLIFGNGGSAAMSQHAVAELVGRYRRERRAVRALALSSDISVLTALANDTGYEQVFCRQLEAVGGPGDLAVAMSTSGTSPNIVAGLERATDLGMETILLTGERPDPTLAARCTLCLRVPSADVPRIQELHLLIWHLACESVEVRL